MFTNIAAFFKQTHLEQIIMRQYRSQFISLPRKKEKNLYPFLFERETFNLNSCHNTLESGLVSRKQLNQHQETESKLMVFRREAYSVDFH